jgi:glycosyltransferase involved in cell wall biosynthesis
MTPAYDRIDERNRRAHPAPLLSVVIPAYNSARFIGEAIESVLAQGHPEIELLVVDDGSTDDTADVVARHGKPVKLVRQQNSGAAVARNTGMRVARGRYVAFLDADDLWLPGKIDAQLAHLEQHPDVSLCCTWFDLLQPDSSGTYIVDANKSDRNALDGAGYSKLTYADLLLDCEVWTSTVVVRRELLDQVGGFDPALRRGQDYDYWLRASRITPIHRLDATLALYRMGSGHGKMFAEKNWGLAVISKALEQWGVTGPEGRALSARQIRRRLWQLNFDFGYGQLSLGRLGPAQEAFLEALRQRPCHARTFSYFLASTFSKWRNRAGATGVFS